MLERMSDIPAGLVGLRAVGKLSREDYESVFTPLLEGARSEGHRLRFLFQIGPEFEGFTMGAALEDAKLGIRFLRTFAGCAIVTDREWVRELTRIGAFLLPCPVRVFRSHDRARAIEWLTSIPRETSISHRLLPDLGVIVVEVTGALSVQDFDALGLTADTWIDSHGRLDGVVFHARTFPGWESFGSVVRHIQFVRDHHQKVKRIALAVDGRLAGLAPQVGEHFVRAEIRTFEYAQLEAAVAWASGRAF
jgi:hypothetical protein